MGGQPIDRTKAGSKTATKPPAKGGKPKTDDEFGEMGFDTASAEEAVDWVRKTGAPVPKNGVSDVAPEWPKNLADVPMEVLGELLTYWSGVKAFLAWHSAVHDVEKKALTAQADFEWTKFYLGGTADKVTEKRELANASKDVVTNRRLALKHEAKHKLLEALFIGAEAKYAAVSRELSRREQQFGRNE